MSLLVHGRGGAARAVGACAAALILALGPAPALLGLELDGGLSGGPPWVAGSLIVLRGVPASDLRPGDVISFADRTAPAVRVTEEVLAVTRGADLAVTTRSSGGEARTWLVAPAQPVARIVAALPRGGGVVEVLRSPAGLVGGLAASLAVLFWPRRRRLGIPQGRSMSVVASAGCPGASGDAVPSSGAVGRTINA